MPDDAVWRRDLRTLLEHRGPRLRALAGRSAPDDAADAALVDALTRVFSVYRPASPDEASVRGSHAVVVVDDDAALDDLDRAVREALARGTRGADRRPGTSGSARPDADDGTDGQGEALPPGLVAEVEARVTATRRARAGRRRLLGATALGVSVVLVAGVVWGTGYGPGHGSSAPTAAVAEMQGDLAAVPPYAEGTPVACGTQLELHDVPTGAATVRLRGTASPIAANDTWAGTVSIDPDEVTSGHLELVGAPQVVVVDTRTRSVAAVGVGTVPRFDVGAGTVDVRATVTFPACGGTRPLGPGTYSVVAVQRYQNRVDWPYGTVLTAMSAPVLLAVARSATATDVDGAPAAQPPWLAGTPIACGMADDSLALLPGYFTQYLDELAPPSDGPPGIVLRNAAGGPAPVTTGRRVAVAWVRQGRVVSVGGDVLADPVTRVVPVGGQVLFPAALDTTDWCRPGPRGRYPHRLPAGTYLAVPYAQVVADRAAAAPTLSPAERARRTLGWLVGVPRGVVVGRDGSVRDTTAQDG